MFVLEEGFRALKPLEAAILRTVIYADIFDFPLTPEELHHYLIAPVAVSLEQVQLALASSTVLHHALERVEPYIVRVGRAEIITVRREREAASQKLWGAAVQWGSALGRLPFVRMVALTGALAVRNASDQDDDLDYILVTTPGRVWLARAFAILLVRAAKRRGVVLCPNYVLAETALAQGQHDLFIAHEVAQMVPIVGMALYQRMRAQNAWTAAFLPNANTPFLSEVEHVPVGVWRVSQRFLEWLLGGRLGDVLEHWEYRRKRQRFANALKTPHSTAVLDDQQVKGHFQDHGHPVLNAYAAQLRAYGLDAEPEHVTLRQAGD